MKKIVVGSRTSNLALTQTNWVIDRLKELNLPFEFEVKEIMTKGDRILDVMLSKVGGKGLFVKELELAMLNGEIDMAVHSMKDMPAILPEGLMIASVPERADHRDALISKKYSSLASMPSGAIVGTSSLRRSAQILAKRPDLEIKWIRGNIETRLRKLNEGEYDAILLAVAGLERMGWSDDIITEHMAIDDCLPAVGQGALAIQCRENDEEMIQLLAKINDEKTMRTVTAERAFLHKLEGGCQVPIAAYAELVSDHHVRLTGLVGEPDGKLIISDTLEGDHPEQLGCTLAEQLMKRGAKEILDRVKEEIDHDER
ncbi:hydroxymethylbilane synthase [Pueribacillus sp. YX66]|uniref:hydroxymethylbilane synthase n=1 Tax=Pueribacillus sp. YX66 TaxID=3229242 RepID=UPI00358D1D8C